MVLFANLRDRQQIKTFAQQMYPGDSSNIFNLAGFVKKMLTQRISYLFCLFVANAMMNTILQMCKYICFDNIYGEFPQNIYTVARSLK